MPDNDVRNRYAPRLKDDQDNGDGAEPFIPLGKCGVVWPKGAKALDVERGAEPVVTLQYVYLSVKAEFTPTKFKVVFVGMESWAVTVHGTNLRRLFDRLNDHCLRKLIQADRSFVKDDSEPFVSEIEVVDVTPKEKSEA